MKRSKNKSLVSLIAVVCVFLVGGTIAYFSDRESVTNTFTMGRLSGGIVEEFEPPDNWQPGTQTKKEVKIQNDGNVDFVVLASFTERCRRREDIVIPIYNNETKQYDDKVVAKAGEKLPVIFQDDEGSWQDVGIKDFGADVLEYNPAMPVESYKDKWVYVREIPRNDENNDIHDRVTYRFLYVGVVKAGNTSPNLLESVTMNPLLKSNVTKVVEHAYYDKASGESKRDTSYELADPGYDSAKYNINIQADRLQATKAAITDEWKPGLVSADKITIPKEFEGLIEYLKTLCEE